MNTNQLLSIANKLLAMSGAAVLATTASKAPPIAHAGQFLAAFLNGPDAAALVVMGVSFLLSHLHHGIPTPNQAAAPVPPSSSPAVGKAPLFLVISAGAAMILCTGTGCSTTAQQAAYQAAATTTVTVDTAMNLWGAYVAANHPGPTAEAKVKAAFEKYQATMAVVLDTGAIYASTSATNSAAAGPAQAALNTATAQAAAELGDLETLITSYGVKL
jgi:hypothetical protein